MKRISILLLVCSLMLVVSASAFGALHNSDSDFLSFNSATSYSYPSFGGWYYIDKDTAYAKINTNLGTSGDIGALYVKDDQTFAEFSRDDSANTWFNGSYKFDNGLFAGLKHKLVTSGGTDSYSDLGTLGYAYTLGDNGYIAVSGDFYSFNAQNGNVASIMGFGGPKTGRGTAGYEADFRYYTDQMRIYGQLYESLTNSWMTKGFKSQLGVNYQLQDSLIAGMELDSAPSDTTYALGLTYTEDTNELNLKYSQETVNSTKVSTTSLLDLFKVNDNMLIGPYFVNASSAATTPGTTFSLLAKYALTDTNNLRLKYQFANSKKNIDSMLSLGYYMGF